MIKLPFSCAVLAAVLASQFSAIYAAAPAEAMHAYTVKASDNLYRIAKDLLNSPDDWQIVARLNHIKNPNLLQPGSTVKIPLRLMRGVTQTAQILYLRGDVQIIAGPSKGKTPIIGQTLREGDTIVAGASAWLGLGLQDGSQMYVSPNSQFKLQRLRDVPQAGVQQTELALKRGRADFTVTPQQPGSRFEVKTPLAVTGVRGTRFGVATSDNHQRTLTDLVEGKVAFVAGKEIDLMAGNGIVLNKGQPHQLQPLLDAPQLEQDVSRVDALPFVLPLAQRATLTRYLSQLETATQPAQIVWLSDAKTPTLSSPIADGHYVLRLRAFSVDGLAGKELVTPVQIKTTPAAPLIQAPLQNAFVPSGKVPLLCAGDEDAKGYLFQVSKNIEFKGDTQEGEVSGANCRWNPLIDQLQTYFWRVASLEQDAAQAWQRGPFSAAIAFVVVQAPRSPEAKVIYSDQLRVQWAGEAETVYQLQIAREREFTDLILDLQLSEPQAALDIPLGCFDYFIRIKSTNQYGMSSDFSKPRRLNTPAVLCSSNGTGIVDGQGKPLRIKD